MLNSTATWLGDVGATGDPAVKVVTGSVEVIVAAQDILFHVLSGDVEAPRGNGDYGRLLVPGSLRHFILRTRWVRGGKVSECRGQGSPM